MEKRHKKERKQKNGFAQFREPSADIQTYNGPVLPRAMKEESELYTAPLGFAGTISSTAGGVIDAYYSSDPASFGLAEWTSLAAVYGEYRVLALEVKYWPINRYSKTTTIFTLCGLM
jgi:hypothetical protein